MELVNSHDQSASPAKGDDESRKRQISSRVITTDDDIDHYVEVEPEDEIVELGPEYSKSQPGVELGEADDGIVEESVSDVYYIPPLSSQQEPIHNQEEEGTPTPSGRAQGQAHRLPILARITSQLNPPSKKNTRPFSPSSSSAATDNPSPEKLVPDQTSRSKAESAAGSGSHSLTERSTKLISITSPIPRSKGMGSSGPPTTILIPTPPRNTDSSANVEDGGHRSPILSPGAKERLEQFDNAVIEIELSKGKEKEQQLEDGAILGKVKKMWETEGEEGKDGETAVTGSGRQEHESVLTSQMKDMELGASPLKPPEIEKKEKTEPLFLPDEFDSNTNSHARLTPRAEAKNQNSKSESKERGKEQLNKHLSSHRPSEDEDESGVESDADANARTPSKWRTKTMLRHKPVSGSGSRLADTEEVEKAEGDNSSSIHVGSANSKLTDRKTFNASSKTPPSTTAVRRSANTRRSNSFVHDIISETENSRPQSQEIDVQVPIVSHLLVPPTTPPVNMKFTSKSRMKPKTPRPKSRPLSRTSSAVEVLALGVQLGMDMDVGNDVVEKLNDELDGVDEAIKKTSNKKANLAMTMESSGTIPRMSSRTSKSRSQSRSVSSQKSKNEKEPVPAEAEMPFTVSIHRESVQTSRPVDSQVNFDHHFPTVLIISSFAYQTGSAENSLHLGAAMHLLNTKSEEISKLENQLSVEQRTNEDLLQQLSALRRQITVSTNNTASTTELLEQELAEARAQLALQTVSWENERATLTLNIETAIRGKVSAEQDRDFFREQYAKASGFVSSVRDENVELEKQIKIATDQAQSGISLIRTTFELRTKSLQEDVRAWRRTAEFLMEKDHRTNDDIRRRAAEEPELRARCDRQESALEDISERLLQLEMDLDEKQRQLVEAEEAKKTWQEMTKKLILDLDEAKTKLERTGKVGMGDESDESPPSPNGHELVYRCEWRLDGSNVACEAVFLDTSVSMFPILALLPIIVDLSLIDRNFRNTYLGDIFNWIHYINLTL